MSENGNIPPEIGRNGCFEAERLLLLRVVRPLTRRKYGLPNAEGIEMEMAPAARRSSASRKRQRA
ncbi:MAG: hypothetical protein CSA76_03545 [Spirochaetales bacterium]|nr:MAG: hypothetical protein CSA76_03545 [Spirochaetales bacterium]